MPYAEIVVMNPSPRNWDDSIALSSVISFNLVPTGSATIDISTLSITMILRGGLTNNTQVRTFNYGTATGLTAKGTATDGYVVRFDPYPFFALNFESRQDIEIRISCKDNLNLDMRRTNLYFKAINSAQVAAFSDLVKEVTEIFQNREQGRIDRGGEQVGFTYRNWSTIDELKPKIYKNTIELLETEYNLRYTEGKVLFDDPLRWQDPVDTIEADYYFSIIGADQMVGFMKSALDQYNAFRPQTTFTLSTAPMYAQAIIILGAAQLALASVLAGFGNQQVQQIYGDSWKEIMANLQNQRDHYKSLVDKMLEEKRYKLANVVSITIPEYSLPGGRSRYFRYLYKGGETGS